MISVETRFNRVLVRNGCDEMELWICSWPSNEYERKEISGHSGNNNEDAIKFQPFRYYSVAPYFAGLRWRRGKLS